MQDRIHIDGQERHVHDVMNPVGMFSNGNRQKEYSSTNDPLPMSGKLIPEFFGRRNIRDMFSRNPSLPKFQTTTTAGVEIDSIQNDQVTAEATSSVKVSAIQTNTADGSISNSTLRSTKSLAVGKKRTLAESSTSKLSKRTKSGSAPTAPLAPGKGQQSLKGFFKPKVATPAGGADNVVELKAFTAPEYGECLDLGTPTGTEVSDADESHNRIPNVPNSLPSTPNHVGIQPITRGTGLLDNSLMSASSSPTQSQEIVHDPVESMESWSKIFTRPAAPRCEGHSEPCITLLTKKPGMNLGRSFWMCPRPLGPSGAKEKNTQWRCLTFIWCSDWNSTATNSG